MKDDSSDAASWVELRLTDSLNRPLTGARYVVFAGHEPLDEARLAAGKLGSDGLIAMPWSPDGLTINVCYRNLLLRRSTGDASSRARDRLTCLGFDVGSPNRPADAERVAEALEALADVAHHDAGTPRDVDRDRLLEDWVSGDAGLREPTRAPVRRRRGLRVRFRQFVDSLPDALVAQPPTPSGSHLLAGDDEHLDEAQRRMCHRVNLAVQVGARGSRTSRNRVVVFDWFTGLGMPPTGGNRIEALVDGEEAWGATARDLAAARQELCVTTWSAHPDIELVRPEEDVFRNPDQREEYRFTSYVEALAERGGRTTILLWNWVGTPILNPVLRRWALRAGDNVEVMQRAHPQVTGSFHQKTMVIDRRVAYCGGFNLRENDWDTQEHRLDDPRRNPHAMAGFDRRAPWPSFPPRHDVAVRIEGPLVDDVHDNFVEYWNRTLRSERRDKRRPLGRLTAKILGVGPADRVRPTFERREGKGPMVAQLVRTDPERRPKEQAIYDVLLRAIHNARKMIFIENQYFRSRQIAAALVATLRKHPRMPIIVVTNRIDPPWRFAHGGAFYTHEMQAAVRTVRPDFRLHELLACGEVDGAVRYGPIYLHSKTMVVDDEWATVGSANINERSIFSDPEANVAVEDHAFARDLRCKLMAEHLGVAPDDPRLADPQEAAAFWHERVEENAAARRAHKLAPGHAHPFEQEPSWSLLRGRATWF